MLLTMQDFRDAEDAVRALDGYRGWVSILGAWDHAYMHWASNHCLAVWASVYA